MATAQTDARIKIERPTEERLKALGV